MRNLHRRFDRRYYIGQIYGGDFAKFYGLLRIYELYWLRSLLITTLIEIDKFIHSNFHIKFSVATSTGGNWTVTPQQGRHHWPQEGLDESGFVEGAEEDAGADAIEGAGEEAEDDAVEEAEVDPGVAPLQALPQAPAQVPNQDPAPVPIQDPAQVPIHDPILDPAHAPADAPTAIALLWQKAMGDKVIAAQKATALSEGGTEAASANRAASKSWSAFIQAIGNVFVPYLPPL